jgi:hypothetical protein
LRFARFAAAQSFQEIGKATSSLDEVAGGGQQPRQRWYACSDPVLTHESTLQQIKEVGEVTVCNAYGAAIKKRLSRVDTASNEQKLC